jgi:hypothetical protein
MTLRKGAVYSALTQQKLNSKSYIDNKLLSVEVGVNDVMPQVLWTRYFQKRKLLDCVSR